jgi:protein-disulfide isomerase
MLMIGLLAAATGVAATYAATTATVSPTDRSAIEAIVKNYILENPEILPQAMERLQGRETVKAIAANRALIETPFAGAWEGAKDADVTLVQFFDYACGYCRASLPDIDRLLKEDPKLRVVYREMPVLGPDSDAAAHLSLAVAKLGRYAEFHRALYSAGRPDAAARTRLARSYGIDARATQAADVREEVATNLQLQSALRLSGTPAWIVGNKLLSGAVGYAPLKAAIAEVRAAKK